MNVQPAASYEAVIDTGGVYPTIGLEVNDNLGFIAQSFVGGATQIAPGVYSIHGLVAPAAAGQYTIVWRDAPGGTTLGVEDLTVTLLDEPPVGAPPGPPGTSPLMTFKEIQDEVIRVRFSEEDRTSVRRWINHRLREVWNDSEWPFRRIFRESWNVTANPFSAPAPVERIIRLDLPDGSSLNALNDVDFFNSYPVGSANGGGTAQDFAFINRQVWFGPGTPSTVSASYRRSVCHLDATGALVPGLMVYDGDTPAWDPDFHYMLVIGAMSTGLKINNDLTWDPLEQEYAQTLGGMREFYLPPDQYGNSQYGRDSL